MALNIPDCIKNWIKASLNVKGAFSHNKSIALKTSETEEWMASCGLTERQVAWLVVHGLDDIPVCRTCGKPLQNFEIKGKTHCSKKCAKNDPETERKLRETNLEKYGTEYTCQAESVKAKTRQSNLERYGVENPMQNAGVKERVRQSMLETYGVEHALQSKECQSKRAATCQERFGTAAPMQNDLVKAKARQTSLERYGAENPMQNEEVRKRLAETCLDRYGTESAIQNRYVKAKAETTLKSRTGYRHPLQNPETLHKVQATTMEHYGVKSSLQAKDVQDRIRETNIRRYGVSNAMQSPEIQERAAQTNIERYGARCPLSSEEIKTNLRIERRLKFWDGSLKRFSAKGIDVLSSKEECLASEQVQYRCRLCGTEFSSLSFSSQAVCCPSCLKKTVSAKEKDLVQFLRSICPDEIIENTKRIIPPFELDAYIPSRSLAVEFNGTYWHSSAFKNRNYHLEKTKACAERGIRLIHVFEWEWDRSRDIVQDILAGALGCYGRTVYARSCDVREVPADEYEAFLSAYHLQGAVKSSLRLGLHLDGELLMCCGWGRSRFNSKETELHRMCAKAGTRVVGGFSKLIAHSGLDRFVSYVDIAHFTGQGYEAAGFRQIGTTPPGYRWIRNGSVLSRQQAQKSRLPRLLGENFDPDLTEVQNMENCGWCREFDCGNLKMEWRK